MYYYKLHSRVCFKPLNNWIMSLKPLAGWKARSGFLHGSAAYKPVTMRFLDSSSRRGAFAGSFGCQLLPGRLSTSRFTCSLLCTGHFPSLFSLGRPLKNKSGNLVIIQNIWKNGMCLVGFKKKKIMKNDNLHSFTIGSGMHKHCWNRCICQKIHKFNDYLLQINFMKQIKCMASFLYTSKEILKHTTCITKREEAISTQQRKRILFCKCPITAV